ncbi:hypothetical protein BC937DRAFT_90986 [Endogone sp. FLAS-F59071]|nr:hypothetical protein BC937DRAFT_90986 [Endogone sp. FLAS-F59071]|eukprot:RUS16624.1 hypothetical protein BC937DRAFT_90986 [Endogone sp. FLAS-F59071]
MKALLLGSGKGFTILSKSHHQKFAIIFPRYTSAIRLSSNCHLPVIARHTEVSVSGMFHLNKTSFSFLSLTIKVLSLAASPLPDSDSGGLNPNPHQKIWNSPFDHAADP